MQFELVERVAIWVALILSVVNIVIAFLAFEIGREKFKPAIDISLEELPPYDTEGQTTVIQIKNNGGRDALLDAIEVEFAPVLDYPLTITELKNNKVGVKDSVSESVRLPEPIIGMNKVTVTLYYRFGWFGRQSGICTLESNYEVTE